MYSEQLKHSNLNTLSYESLIHLCRLEDISFDMNMLTGFIPVIAGEIKANIIGCLTIQASKMSTTQTLFDTLVFLESQLGPPAVPMMYHCCPPQDDRNVNELAGSLRKIHHMLKHERRSFLVDII